MSQTATTGTPAARPARLSQNPAIIPIDIAPNYTFTPTVIEMVIGKSYRLDITRLGGDTDGGRNNQLHAPVFFQNCFILLARIAGVEIKTRTIDYLEFDVPGTISVVVVPTRTGAFPFWVSGTAAMNQGVIIVRSEA